MVARTFMEMWEEQDVDTDMIEVDCLMPNGILIPLEVARDWSLAQIKEVLWRKSQSYPLYSMLKDRNTYEFMCINRMAEKQDLLDESRSLDEVRPFQPFETLSTDDEETKLVEPFCPLLRVIEKKGDREEKQLAQKISSVIGRSLNEFDALKEAEISDFREDMRQLCKEFKRDRALKPKMERIMMEFPPQVVNSPELPQNLLDRLRATDGQFRIEVRIPQPTDKHDQVEYCSTVVIVPPAAMPYELINSVLLRKSKQLGWGVESNDDFLLRICGRQEYLIGDYQLSQYQYMRQMLTKQETPKLVLEEKNAVLRDEPPPLIPRERGGMNTNSIFGNRPPIQPPKMPTQSHKQTDICAWAINEPYSLTVHGAHGVSTLMSSDDGGKIAGVKFYLRVGMYHGDAIARCANTKGVPAVDGHAEWNETLTFDDLLVENVPRMARLCFLLYASHDRRMRSTVGRRVKEGRHEIVTIAWVNISVYDYKAILRTGEQILDMWPITNDNQLTEDLLNPIGAVEYNPDPGGATRLSITLSSYMSQQPISNDSRRKASVSSVSSTSSSIPRLIRYPSFDKVLELAAQHINYSSPSLPPNTTKEKKIVERIKDATFDEGVVTKQKLKNLEDIIERDPLSPLHEQDKEIIWMLKYECLHHFPHSLPRLLGCVQWNNRIAVAQMQALLQAWKKLDPKQALELLDCNYADCHVRSFAVQCLQQMSDCDILQYLLQLVQVLKYELYVKCDLVEFLLQRALNNQKIGHYFFWLLRYIVCHSLNNQEIGHYFWLVMSVCRGLNSQQIGHYYVWLPTSQKVGSYYLQFRRSEMHVPSVSVRYGVILEAYCRSSGNHMDDLRRQVDALHKLHGLNLLMKKDTGGKDKKSLGDAKKDLVEVLRLPQYRAILSNLSSTLDPFFRLSELRIDECRVKDSKMRPLMLVWENIDPLGSDIKLIYKVGDDLRQDMVTLQILRVMDSIWQENGLDLRMNAYGCLATNNNEGLIEFVKNSNTIANIQKDRPGVIAGVNKESIYFWLHQKNPNSMDSAVEEFTRSCAGYCVATYVLGVGDRHSDNIMLKENGQLFHIDFGHILGHFKSKFGFNRERVPFVLTPDFVYAIKNGPKEDDKLFNRFRDLCETAYSILHCKSHFLITLFLMMMNTGIPHISGLNDVEYLKKALRPDLNEEEAVTHFRKKFQESLRLSKWATLNFAIHNAWRDNK